MYCPNCGREISVSSRFCPYCGAAVSEEQPRAWAPDADRPLDSLPARDLSQLLNETFGTYRRYFRQFLILAFLPQIFFLVAIPAPFGLSVILVIAGAVVYVVASAATAYAVAQQCTGSDVRVGPCLAQAWNRVVVLIVTAVLFLLALAGSAVLMVIIVGIPLFFYLLVSWFFIEQAIMIEGKGITEAFRRSRSLVKGTWWRVFGIGVVFAVILVVLGVLGGLVSTGIGLGSPTAGAIIGALVNALIFPIAPIGATLVYFDLRVRKEGYTLREMASEVA